MPDIKCPACGHEFPLEEAVSEDYKKELREQMVSYKKQKEEELARKEQEWQRQLQKKETEFGELLQSEKARLQQQLEENIRKTITGDFENKVRLLEQSQKVNEEKLRLARQKELEFLQMQQDLKTREEELNLTVQKKLQEERSKLSEELRKLEEQKAAARENEYQLRLKELEKQLEDQKKLADEMRRKAEQGSMQLQGEVQELALEEMLKAAFPFDEIREVGKGVRGADCIQAVRNNFGQECGQIIYESKRTNSFSIEWIDKLKADMRSQGAEIAVIVTKTMPKDMDCFGIKDGVWICSFSEVKSLAVVLRDAVIRVFNAAKSQENKGDKMHLLYNYLTSSEFSEQWKAIREGFMNMKLSIQKERDAMEKLWKSREKQLEKVLLNAAHVRGSIEGIAGMDSVDLNLLDNSTGEEE
ncbi:MAG TPA: DUF2130 domain-containing protein [Chitinophagaceae bacterium]|nr:DUF2130 domain-containing protein [Chitinophagaceae bacterium]